MSTINVTIYNEYVHEQEEERIRKVYPDGIHGAIASFLKKEAGFEIQTATLDMPEHGLTEDVLKKTDVLIWWGHKAHDKVKDEIVDRVQKRVLEGMGLIVLHSGHFSKIFKRMMGTGCGLGWREADESERLWVIDPTHPITEGLGAYIDIDHEEMYSEFFDIPEPDQLVFIGWFKGGNVFRSGATWRRGKGKVFYFQPGHESYPIYYKEEIQKVITNGVRWAAFAGNKAADHLNTCVQMKEPLEKL